MSTQLNAPKLILYYRNFCVYCSRVVGVANKLQIKIEGKNIGDDMQAMSDLQIATGRFTVPVLKIESEEGSVTWMAESQDIVAYLQKIAA